MPTKMATAADISALIAVEMAYCQECRCVSAPDIEWTTPDPEGWNWKTANWRGDAEAILRCRVAMFNAIEVIAAYYRLAE